MLQIVLVAVTVAALALMVLMRVAPRLGWLDRPDPRKPHLLPVPPVGGVAWLCALLTVLATTGQLPHLPVLIACLLLMLLTGLIDDLRPLPSWLRLALQLIIAASLALTGFTELQSLGTLVPGTAAVTLGLLAVPMTIFSLVGVINAVNMADGMDGLAGSYLLIALLALVALHAGQNASATDCTLAVAGAAALLPFLSLNLRLPWQTRARVFLGDSGSMAAGLLVGVLLIRGSQGADAVFAPTVALWLLAVPLIDTVSVMLRRIAAGRSPFAPDQQHVHHVLLRAGLSVARVWQVLAGAALLMALTGVWSQRLAVPESAQFIVFLMIAGAYHAWVCRGLRVGQVLGRPLTPQLSQL
jgi:UDP-GlcNAc:undecaprenyl-phosphate GlcNAc-1-phosphate transferase